MTFLNVLPTEQRQQQQEIALTAPGQYEPGFFEGVPQAIGYGVGRFANVLGRVSGEAIYQVNAPIYEQIDYLFGTEYRAQADRDLRDRTREAVAAMTPDPYTTGFLGRLVYGLVGVGLPALAGGAVGGPGGAAYTAGLSQGIGTYADLTAQGVDQSTALDAATFDGLMMAGGVAAPAAIGGRAALSTLLYGPGVNVAQDIAASQALSKILDSGGYTELAERYAQIDGATVVANALLGAGFGYLGSRGTDAALTIRNQRHAEVETAPGIPANAVASQEHARALQAATEQLLEGRPVSVDTPRGEFAPKPDFFKDSDISAVFRESGYPELLDDIRGLEAELAARGLSLDDDALPRVERRGDAANAMRLQELRSEWKAGRLDARGLDELQRLETQDRMAAKVAGRRIPGVLNMEAFNEMEAQLGPVRGFADADNFKSINDQLGHGVGDQAIATLGRVFAEELGEGGVFHRGGDEFVFAASDVKTFRAAMERARARLESAELVATRADGTTVSRKGIRFSYGEGKTVEEAESAQYRDKDARKAAGLRTDRDKPSADAQRGSEVVAEQGGPNRAGRNQAAAEIVSQAAEIAREVPSLRVVDEGGQKAKAADIMAEGDKIEADAQRDSAAYLAAVNCFFRGGA